MKISVRFTVAAAHFLPNYPGKCQHLHGHNYEIRLVCEGAPDPVTGMVIDFHAVERVFRPVFDKVDHRLLNDVIPNPTAELFAVWLWEQVSPQLPALRGIEVDEMDGYRVSYDG